jgi:hypothetical protein
MGEKILSSGMGNRVVWQKYTDVSEELTASIFKTQQYIENASNEQQGRSLTAVRTWNIKRTGEISTESYESIPIFNY